MIENNCFVPSVYKLLQQSGASPRRRDVREESFDYVVRSNGATLTSPWEIVCDLYCEVLHKRKTRRSPPPHHPKRSAITLRTSKSHSLLHDNQGFFFHDRKFMPR